MKYARLFSIVFIGLMAFASVGHAQSTTVTIIGSNTVFPIMDATASFYNEFVDPNIEFSVQGPGSGAAVSNLIAGTSDLGPMSRLPKPSEYNDLAAASIDVNVTVVAIDAIVMVVNKDNPLSDITSQQITDIYNATVTDWADLGWADGGNIKVIERDEVSGTHEYFNDQFLDGNEVPTSAVFAHAQYASTKQLFEDVSDNKNAIGYGGLGFLDNTVKALTVDGVVASTATAKDFSYPISRDIYTIFDPATVSDAAKAFLDFVTGPVGQVIAETVGYVAKYPTDEDAYNAYLEGDEGNGPFSLAGLFAGIAAIAIITHKKKKL